MNSKRAEQDVVKLEARPEAHAEPCTAEPMRASQPAPSFAAVLSHDLREPLRAVKSFARLLDEDYGGQLDETGRTYLAHVVQGAERMERMLDDVLAYAAARADETLSVDAVQALDDAIQNLDVELRGVTVTRDALPHLTFSRGQLTRVLQNLLSNAAKYRSSAAPAVHVGVDYASHPGFARLFVADNGRGVPAPFRTQIFEPFRRLQPTDEVAGTGLGLAIVKDIVERHGGAVWVEPRETCGSVFSFTVPLSADESHKS